jgi:putative tricarboxylic transport membrane protein
MPAGPHADGAPPAPSATGGEGGRWHVHSDVIIAGVILAFCAAVYAATFTFDTVPSSLSQGMQPQVFPQLVLAVMALLALVLAWSSRGKPDLAREPVPRMVYLTAAVIVAFMGVIYAAGLIAGTVFTAAIGRLWGERRWWLLALTAIGLAVAVQLIFVNGFGIQMPRSVLGNWLE